MDQAIEIVGHIMLPESATIGRRLRIEHFGAIIVHGETVIGDDHAIRKGVITAAPLIGKQVDIGAGAKIIARLTIGGQAVIGADVLVIRDLPVMGVAVGVPDMSKPRLPHSWPPPPCKTADICGGPPPTGCA